MSSSSSVASLFVFKELKGEESSKKKHFQSTSNSSELSFDFKIIDLEGWKHESSLGYGSSHIISALRFETRLQRRFDMSNQKLKMAQSRRMKIAFRSETVRVTRLAMLGCFRVTIFNPMINPRLMSSWAARESRISFPLLIFSPSILNGATVKINWSFSRFPHIQPGTFS